MIARKRDELFAPTNDLSRLVGDDRVDGVSELRIGEIADRLIEIRVVEDVEGFRAE